MLRRPRESCGGASAAASCCAQLPAAGSSSRPAVRARAWASIVREHRPFPRRSGGAKGTPSAGCPLVPSVAKRVLPALAYSVLAQQSQRQRESGAWQWNWCCRSANFRHPAAVCRSARYCDHAVQWNWCCVRTTFVRTATVYLCTRGPRPE